MSNPTIDATSPAMDSTTPRYDSNTIRLHWATAILVVLLLGIGQIIDFFPRGEPRVMVRSVHILLGVALAVVFVMRIIWRSTSGYKLPAAEKGLVGLSAKIVHFGLYLLLIATIALGVANVWMRGDSIFGLFSIPRYPDADKALRHVIGDLHGTFADAIMIVAGLHAIAALAHHYVFKDNVLRRMLPWK